MNNKVEIDFPEDFYENLAKSLKKEKRWYNHIHDWMPLIVSAVTCFAIIWVSFIVPRKQEVDLHVSINREIEIHRVPNQPKVELLIIPIRVHNNGNTVVLQEYANIVFLEGSKNKFSVQGLFQNRDSLRVGSRSSKDLLLNVTNQSFPSYLKIKSFRELLGKTRIQVKLTARNKTVPSGPIEFSQSNVIYK